VETELKSLLFETDNKGYLRVWDIYMGELLKSIKTDDCLVGITVWNNQYILAACKGGIRVIDTIHETVVSFLSGTENILHGTTAKFKHPELGECLMTSSGGSYKDNQISLWSF